LPTYSFKDVSAALAGPGGTIAFADPTQATPIQSVGVGNRAGVADEGIAVERTEDVNTMQTGADGEVMHSLHAADSGTIRIRLLKTSPINSTLQSMLDQQRLSGATWGRNTFQLRDHIRGDIVTGREVAFTGHAPLAYGKTGNVNEWSFHAGHLTIHLGDGTPPPTV
jgi:hypothetical protein